MIFTFDSSQPGAPSLSGVAGTLRTLLKACLVDGFGAGAVATLTVSAEVATATYAGSHPFKVGCVAQYAGATPAGLNGNKVILSATGTSVTFAAPGVPDGAATGTITSKAAPAGWQELFAGALTNVIALKPSVVEATGCVLCVDDTGTINARVRAYEAMSGISTGVGMTPLESQAAGGLWWPKSATEDATARPWSLAADERGFLLALDPQGRGRYTLVWFGDVASLKGVDPYGCLITGNQFNQVAITSAPDGCVGFSHRSAKGGAYFVRSYTGLSGAVGVGRVGAAHNGTASDAYSGAAGYSFAVYPNGANNGLLTTPLELWSFGLRGTLPGLQHVRNTTTTEFASGVVQQGSGDLTGRQLLLLRVAPPAGDAAGGLVVIDQTGPWVR